MTGEAVDEIVLAAVSLVGNDHDVAALRERRIGVALLFGQELLDGGEHHASGCHREPAAQIGSTLGLGRRLSQEVPAAGEGAEELVIQVVSVCQHHHGRVLHGRLADDAPGVEGHGQALARTLGVPDHPDAPVAGRTATLAARLVEPALFGRLQFGCPQSLGDRHLDRVELVIAGHLLDQRTAAIVLEHDEVADQRKKSLRFADAFQHHLQLGQMRSGQRFPADGAPGFEPLPPCGESAHAGLDPVGDHEHLVHGEEAGQFRFVGLKLLPSCPEGGVLIGRLLELDDAQRQAVDEQHHVGPAGVLILCDGELVDRQPVVAGGFVEVDDLHLRPANGAFGRPVLHRHALHQHPVKGAVSSFQRGPLWSDQLAKGVLKSVCRQVRVDCGQGIAQALGQHYFAIIGSLCARRVRCNVGSVGHLPPDIRQPVQRDLLDIGFGECGHLALVSLSAQGTGSSSCVNRFRYDP